jgi:2-C-methyl-D-erythritol 4-phosphate cytidylyltransferase/2-C-methyl-D-erythritol 2,4-cyclodiphosphate synthase
MVCDASPMISEHPRAAAVVLAAGVGRRLGAEVPKAFLPLGGRPILSVVAAAAAASPAISSIVVTAPPGYEQEARACLEGLEIPSTVVTGGRTRQASVRAALSALGDEVDVVAIHDAARPFAPPDLFTTVVLAVEAGADGAVPVIPVTDTVKMVLGGRVSETLDREELGLAQTPQAFRVTPLRKAHDEAAAEGREVTDDSMLLESGGGVVVVAGDPMNFKVTTMFDLARAQARMGTGDG